MQIRWSDGVPNQTVKPICELKIMIAKSSSVLNVALKYASCAEIRGMATKLVVKVPCNNS